MVLLNPSLVVALVIVAALPTDAATNVDERQGPSVYFNVFRFVSIVALVGLSSIFSGLTLGLLSLDKLGLEVTIGAGEREGASDEERANAAAAARILPVRANGNELLSTLVLGNISVNSLLSILLADLTSGLVGFLVSTAVIVTFGEIIPQALCSRHALAIGSRLVPLVKVLLVVFYPAAKPVSIAINYTLGADLGTVFFSKLELQKLLELHVEQETLHPDEGHIVRDAVGYKHKLVSEVMVRTARVYALPATTTLTLDAIKRIYTSGFSRVPVYGKDVNDVLGVVLAKDLVYVDPRANVPLREFVTVFARTAHRVWADATLGDVLSVFKEGRTHLALVYDVNNTGLGDPFYELQGIVTLEDVVEEILQDKILDDTDSTDAHRERVSCADRITLDYV